MDIFKKIGPVDNAPPSEMKDLFLRWQRKEISNDEYYLGNAHGMAVSLDQWRPAIYEEATIELRTYIESRLKGTREYDRPISIRLGIWLHGLTRMIEHNSKNMDSLLWGEKILRANGLPTEADKIQMFMGNYQKLVFPEPDYMAGRKAQAKDSLAAQYKQKGDR